MEEIGSKPEACEMKIVDYLPNTDKQTDKLTAIKYGLTHLWSDGPPGPRHHQNRRDWKSIELGAMPKETGWFLPIAN